MTHHEIESQIAEAKKYLEEGDDFVKEGRQNDAISSYEKSLCIFQEHQYDIGIAEALNSLGLVNFDKGEYNQALDQFQKCAEILKNLKNLQGLSAVLGNIIFIQYLITGELEKALEYYEKSIELQKEFKDIEGLLKNYNRIGSLLDKKGECDKAIEYYKKAIKLSETNINLSKVSLNEIGRAYNNAAILFKNRGFWIKAKEYYENSLIFFREANNERGEAAVLGNLGIIEMEVGDWNIAMSYIKRDFELSMKIDSTLGKAESQGNMGLLCSKMGLFNDAFNHYQRALILFEELGDLEKKVRTLNNLGDLQIKAGNWEEAKRNLEEALETASNPITKISILLDIGNLLKIEKEYKKAHSSYNKAAEIIEKIGAKPRKIDFLNKLGELYYSCYRNNEDNKWLKLAIRQFEEAFKLSKEYNIIISKAYSLKNIAMVQAINDIENAIITLKESIEIFDRIGSNYDSACSVIQLARLLFENGNNQEAMFMAEKGLLNSMRRDFKILQIESSILLGDITQKEEYYIDAQKIALFNPKIYKRTCYMIIRHTKKLDNKIKIELFKDMKNINQDKDFDEFLNTLILMLKGNKYNIGENLPTSLREELLIFEKAD